jgi:hypothetical protein
MEYFILPLRKNNKWDNNRKYRDIGWGNKERRGERIQEREEEKHLGRQV